MLADDGLADDTIIFFIGDNGHGVPSGKVWLWDEGPHVPAPSCVFLEMGESCAEKPGTVSGRLVSFVDFAPTMLSLAGVPIPGDVQGSAFLGPKSGEPRRYVYAARDFHDGADFDTCRMVRDERFYYLRNFMPQIGWDAIQYSWQRPYMLEEWRQYAQAGKLKDDARQACFFRRRKPAEELYDMQADPWQLHNLAGEPKQQATLRRLRGECERWMVENRNLGLLSQHELYTRSEKDSPLEMGMDSKRNPVRQLLDAADVANRCDAAAIRPCFELRLGESVALSWDDSAPFAVDLTGRHPRFRIKGEAQKSGRDELTPISPDFGEFLLQIPEAKRHGRVFRLFRDGGAIPLVNAERVGCVVDAIGRKVEVIVNAVDGKTATAHDLDRTFGDQVGQDGSCRRSSGS